MKLHPPRRYLDGDRVRVESRVECCGGETCVSFSLDRRWEGAITETKCDAFLLPALLRAMHHDEDIELAAPVSARLFYNVTNYLIPLLCEQDPTRHRIAVRPHSLDCGERTPSVRGVACGFSGGVDSLCTVMDHMHPAAVAPYGLTHLLFTNVGSHHSRDPEIAERRFQERLAHVSRTANELRLPLIDVNSNVASFLNYTGSQPYQHTHTLRNASVGLLLQRLLGVFLYSSGCHYGTCYVGTTSDIAYGDPVVIPLLCTESLECVSSGAQYSRPEKTARIADWDVAQRSLHVCVRDTADGSNCSVCSKCCRTLLTLEMLGKEALFAGRFSFTAWRRVRRPYIVKVLRTRRKDPSSADIMQYALKVGYKWPAQARLQSLIPESVASTCAALRDTARSLPRRAFRKLWRLAHGFQPPPGGGHK